MGVDPLQVAQHVEVQGAGLHTLDPAGADAGEVRVGCARLQITKHLLFSQQSPRGTRVVGEEHRSRPLHIAGQPLQHGSNLGLTLSRKGNAALQPLGGHRHQALFDDVAGMFKIGRKGQDLGEPPVVLGVERVRVERGQI
jgi:hypothetical protein